jgi:biotin transport system substrate-specific component
VTGQTFAVLLIGALFGAKLGAAAVLAYLAEGAAGLPVFSAGGATIAHLIGPSGGYLVGFVGAAWVVGALSERGWTAHPITTAVAMIVGAGVYFTVGAAWLALFVGAKNAVFVGIVPFLLGDTLKIALAAIVLPLATRYVTRR